MRSIDRQKICKRRIIINVRYYCKTGQRAVVQTKFRSSIEL